MNLKEFECDLCGKKFSIKLALVNHTKLKHNDGEKETFPCDLCDKTFVLKCNLKRHQNVVHFGLKKVNCHICNKEISDSDFLAAHIRNAHEKKFQCDKCSKWFRTQKDFDLHKAKVHHKNHTKR